jgi:hypothetical protein
MRVQLMNFSITFAPYEQNKDYKTTRAKAESLSVSCPYVFTL